jgi:hypothetical protein
MSDALRAIWRQPKPELEGELVPKPKRKKLIASKPKFAKYWIMSTSRGGPLIITMGVDVTENFLSRNVRRTTAGCGEKSK